MRPSRRIFCFAPTTHTQCLYFVRNTRNRQGVCNVLMVYNCCVLVVCACVCDCDCVCDCGPQRAFATICDGCGLMWSCVDLCGRSRTLMGAEWRSMAYWGVPRRMTADYGASGSFVRHPLRLRPAHHGLHVPKRTVLELPLGDCQRFVAMVGLVNMVGW